MRIFVSFVAVGWLMASTAIGGEPAKTPAACTEVQTCGSADHCGRCGHGGPCQKCCKVVCEMKEVKKTVWVVKCSEFCAPLPNCGLCKDGCGCGNCEACAAGCRTAEPACNDGKCGKCDPCAAEKNKRVVPPKCGKVREKKTLEKKEVVCKVPSYKCVVTYCCSKCEGQPSDNKTAPLPPETKPQTPPPAPTPIKTTQDVSLPSLTGLSF